MNHNSANSAWRIILLCSLALLGNGLRVHAQTMIVSVPVMHLQNNERVIAFEVHVRSGRIARLPNVPIGWNISVENDPSWNTVVRGSIVVGAAALSADFFRRFVVVEGEKPTPSDMPFALDGDVVVTSDFKAERTIRLSMTDFLTESQKSPLGAKSRVPGE